VIALPPTGLRERLASGEISSLDATEAYLDRIALLDDRIGAYITVCSDIALEQASRRDEALARGERLGSLHGLPVAFKDNIDTAGVRTTAGSSFLADNIPTRDAETVRRVLEAGAVLLGKTAMHEFAYGATTQNPHYGPCRNPWDLERVPGGSSGGSGAAVAADLCAAALGTDTGGSVRIPAAVNGVTGLRPTSRLVSNRGVFPVSWTLDTVGPLARSVADIGVLLEVLAGYDPEDARSVKRAQDDDAADQQGVEGLRVGVPTNFFFEDVDTDIVRLVRDAVDLLARLGAVVEKIPLPGCAEALDATGPIIWSEVLAVHRERLAQQPGSFGDDVRRRLELGKAVTGAEYGECRQRARVWRRTVERVFESVDVILTPATGTIAPPADLEMIESTRRLVRLTYAWSLAGVPALALPCGISDSGLPVGLQLAAAPYREATLLRVGAAYQHETDWHLRRPAL
jgi:aspartyl-tRNA(Asn)/glutamyl-tRNA(Gln) amidotransferase subunit A